MSAVGATSSASNWFATAPPGRLSPPDRRLSYAIGQRAFADGLICYPCSGNVDGVAGDTIILAPPYNATDGELEEIATKLTTAIAGALDDLP